MFFLCVFTNVSFSIRPALLHQYIKYLIGKNPASISKKGLVHRGVSTVTHKTMLSDFRSAKEKWQEI